MIGLANNGTRPRPTRSKRFMTFPPMRRSKRPLNSDCPTTSLEFVIQPDLDEVYGRGILLPTEAAAARVEGASFIDKHVLEFSRPMVPHRVFDATSHSERELRFAADRRKAGRGCIGDGGSGIKKGN